jgi:Xaa-Pro aminopeptidase
VCEVDQPVGAERPLYGFETLTLVPIDRTVVEPTLMTPTEIQWLDAYHERVRQTLKPYVDGSVALWLDAATRPLGS